MGAEFWRMIQAVGGFALIGLVLVALIALQRPMPTWGRTVNPRELPLLVVAACILAVPLAVYVLSIRPGGTSLFLPRYFVTCVLGASVVYAHIASRAIELCRLIPHGASRRVVSAAQAMAVTGAIWWVGSERVQHVIEQTTGREKRPVEFPTRKNPGEPVVIEHIHEFLQTLFYSRDPQRYVFPLDPEVGLAEGRGGPLNHQIMAALARQFPEHFAGVKSTEELIASAPSFWIKLGKKIRWYGMRISHDPQFVVDKKGGELRHVRRAP
jgi:hypothetical protein